MAREPEWKDNEIKAIEKAHKFVQRHQPENTDDLTEYQRNLIIAEMALANIIEEIYGDEDEDEDDD